MRGTSNKSVASTNCIRGDLLEIAIYKLARLIQRKERDNIPRLPNQPAPERKYTERACTGPKPIEKIGEATIKKALCAALGIDPEHKKHISSRAILAQALAEKSMEVQNELLMAVDGKNRQMTGASKSYGDFRRGDYTEKTLAFVADAGEIIRDFKPSKFNPEGAVARLAEKLEIPPDKWHKKYPFANLVKDYVLSHGLDIATVVECFQHAPSATSLERHDNIIGKRFAELIAGEPLLFSIPFRDSFVDSLGEALEAAKARKAGESVSQPLAEETSEPVTRITPVEAEENPGIKQFGDMQLAMRRLPLHHETRYTLALSAGAQSAKFAFSMPKKAKPDALLSAIERELTDLAVAGSGFQQTKMAIQTILDNSQLVDAGHSRSGMFRK